MMMRSGTSKDVVGVAGFAVAPMMPFGGFLMLGMFGYDAR